MNIKKILFGISFSIFLSNGTHASLTGMDITTSDANWYVDSFPHSSYGYYAGDFYTPMVTSAPPNNEFTNACCFGGQGLNMDVTSWTNTDVFVLGGVIPDDNRLYDDGNPVIFEFAAQNTGVDSYDTVRLMIKNIDDVTGAQGNALLNNAPQDAVALEQAQLGFDDTITTFKWVLADLWQPGEILDMKFQGDFGFKSYDAFAITADLSANPIPLPGAVWLFGSALAGLRVMRKKK